MSECWRNMGAFQCLDDNVLELLKLAAADTVQPNDTAIQFGRIKVHPNNVSEELKDCLKKFDKRKFPKFVRKYEKKEVYINNNNYYFVIIGRQQWHNRVCRHLT